MCNNGQYMGKAQQFGCDFCLCPDGDSEDTSDDIGSGGVEMTACGPHSNFGVTMVRFFTFFCCSSDHCIEYVVP